MDIEYLKERDYDYIVSGSKHIDIGEAVEKLSKTREVKKILMDSGGILSSILLKNKLADKISLLITPSLVGKESTNLFRSLKCNIRVELLKTRVIDKNYVWLVYRVLKLSKSNKK